MTRTFFLTAEGVGQCQRQVGGPAHAHTDVSERFLCGAPSGAGEGSRQWGWRLLSQLSPETCCGGGDRGGGQQGDGNDDEQVKPAGTSAALARYEDPGN